MTAISQEERRPSGGLDVLADRHRDTVWRYLRVLGGSPSVADDLTQEVFLVALRRPGFTAEAPEAALGFLRATARHLYLRSRRRRTSVREVEAADRVWDERCTDGTGEERLAALRECVGSLSTRHRALLQATYGDDLGRADAAREFGLSEDGVKSALRRLRAFLQGCIERRLRRNTP